jgi:outer membrane lipoprotein-sorting protein
MKPMPSRRAALLLLLLFIACWSSASCLARRRLIVRKGASTAAKLQMASRETLVQAIASQYAAVHDLNATVDMVPALGTAEKGKITEYKDVRAYILVRAPSDIRLIGLFPVVRNKAFDMVANATSFKLYIPSQNRFITGRNEIQQLSKNKLENLRPQHFLEAILVHPVDSSERVLLENYTDEENAYYVLHMVHESGQVLQLSRTIWFNRTDLRLARELIFDASGNILTDARYSDWKTYDNVAFPKHIEINRPRDEYAVVIDVVKADINKGLSDQQFALAQPEGTKLQTIGEVAGQIP